MNLAPLKARKNSSAEALHHEQCAAEICYLYSYVVQQRKENRTDVERVLIYEKPQDPEQST